MLYLGSQGITSETKKPRAGFRKWNCADCLRRSNVANFSEWIRDQREKAFVSDLFCERAVSIGYFSSLQLKGLGSIFRANSPFDRRVSWNFRIISTPDLVTNWKMLFSFSSSQMFTRWSLRFERASLSLSFWTLGNAISYRRRSGNRATRTTKRRNLMNLSFSNVTRKRSLGIRR